MAHSIESAATAVDKDVPVSDLSTMRHKLGAYLKYPQFRAFVLVAFAGIALLLATIGLYGLLADYVAQRTRELGVRIAVGAQRSDIIRLLALQGGVPVVLGLGMGVSLTLALTRYLSSLLFEITPRDPWTTIGAPIALVAAGCLALIRPAIHATRIDPVSALRDE
jgi:putative ABC transport system permease protein